MQINTSPVPKAQVQHIEVGPERAGQRIDNALITFLKGVPKSLIYRLLRTGQVRVNSCRVHADTRLQEGDVIRVPPVRQANNDGKCQPSARQIRQLLDAISFEDRNFLVLNKPAGMASHGGSGVSFGVIELLRAARPQEAFELAHRLDRYTSGLLVLAKRRSALLALQGEIREGRVHKQYLGLLAPTLPRTRVDVNAPLYRPKGGQGERMVRVSVRGKPALTRFREVQRFVGCSLVEATLETGRTHQIRVHAAHIERPVVGDDRYGDRDINRRFQKLGLQRMFLHSIRFEFELGNQLYSFSTPLKSELGALLEKLDPQHKQRVPSSGECRQP